MNELDRRQIKTLFGWELKILALVPVGTLVALVLGMAIDCLYEMFQIMGGLKPTDNLTGWLGCWLACSIVGLASYSGDLYEGTMPYLATRPVSHRRVFFVKIGCGLFASLAASAVAWVAHLLINGSLQGHYESPWSVSFDFGWWYLGPCAYLAALTATLVVPSIIPAYASAFVVAFLVFWLGQWNVALPAALCPVLLCLCYYLARQNRLTQWAASE